MKFYQKKIQEEWHFVVGGGAKDKEEFYRELEKHLAPQIEALRLSTGYRSVGNLLRRKQMHFAKFGKYLSLTCAEPFGTDLNISWYLYFKGGDASSLGTGMSLIASDIMGYITGRTRDRVIAFASVGKDCAEKATQAILSKYKEPEAEKSGKLGEA